MDWRRFDFVLMLGAIITGWLTHIPWGFKVLWTLVCLIAIPSFPLWRLMISQIGAKEVSKETVQSFMKLHEWYTIPELARIMRKKLGHRVSHHNIMEYVWGMESEGKVEGRERQPPEPSYFREGNVHEYRRAL